MARQVVIAVDDTDMPGTRGTGRLARMIADELVEGGLGVALGATRHQFWVGPGVPMTSHNSAAAIGLESDRSLDDIEAFARQIMAREYIPGSDPGLALLEAPPPDAVVAFARRAQRELVQRTEAERLAEEYGLRVRGLAGTRDGMIGSLSAAALRWDGNDGRYVGLPGIRNLAGRCRVAAILAAGPIVAVVDEASGQPLSAAVEVETFDWVRPRLVGGRAVMYAREDRTGGWVNADRRIHND